MQYIKELVSYIGTKDGLTIKHKNNTDVAFFVSSIDDDDANDYVSLKGFWLNIIATVTFTIERDTIQIKRADLPNWTRIENPFRRHAKI